MATAREVRAAVRAQLTEQVKARQDAALAVAASWAKVGKARDRLAVAERDAADAVSAASTDVSVTDLAALTGIPEPELRRLVRSSKPGPRAAADGTSAQTVVDEATAGGGIAEVAEEPAAQSARPIDDAQGRSVLANERR